MIDLALRVGGLVCTVGLERVTQDPVEDDDDDPGMVGSSNVHVERQPLCTDMEVEEARFGFQSSP